MELALSFDVEMVLEPAVRGASDLNCAVKRSAPRASEVERPVRASGFLSYRDKYVTKSGLTGSGLPTDGAKSAHPQSGRELPAEIPAATRAEVQRLAQAAFDVLGCAGSAGVIPSLRLWQALSQRDQHHPRLPGLLPLGGEWSLLRGAARGGGDRGPQHKRSQAAGIRRQPCWPPTSSSAEPT